MNLQGDKVIKEIIKNEKIITVFQPILSIKKNSVVGLEALSRGLYNDRVILPGDLFSLASDAGLTVELDRLCRKRALEIFSAVKSQLGEDTILFLNLDASIIDQGVVGSGVLLGAVNGLDLNPDSVAIEINEAGVKDVDSLHTFINTYRSHGFIIAMDDIGAGHSNLNRVALTRPDILKIDRALVKDLDKEYYKREVFKSLINLARNTGSLVVAEGVESEEEAVTSLDLGVDMIQGFHFSEPREISQISFDTLRKRMVNVAARFKEHALKKITLKNIQNREYEDILSSVVRYLKKIKHAGFDSKLEEIITRHRYLECIYILDERGIQVSDTICNRSMCAHPRPTFRPAPRGTDHSLKDYFYLLAGTGIKKYVTEPYISLATGNLCTTITTYFENACSKKYILCLDAKSKSIV